MRKRNSMSLRGVLTTLMAAAILIGAVLAHAEGEATRPDSKPPAAVPPKEPPSPPHPFAIGGLPQPPPRPPEGRAPVPPSSDDGEVRRRGGRGPGGMHGPEDMEMLDRLLAMPPEQLARVRRALERIEAMTPEERANLRERLQEIRQIPPEQREKMRKEWRELSPEEQNERIREMRARRAEKLLEAEERSEESPPDPK